MNESVLNETVFDSATDAATDSVSGLTAPVRRFRAGRSETVDDVLAVEAALEVRLEIGPEQQRRRVDVSVTMRTPGADEELAVGYLFNEGILNHATDLVEVEAVSGVVTVKVRPDVNVDPALFARQGVANSSCGLCGKASADLIARAERPLPFEAGDWMSPETLKQLPTRLRAAQAVFERTGGLHAAGLFSVDGELLLLREDVGRHNALDKLAGRLFLKPLAAPHALERSVLLLSGRASFELIQKAVRCRIPFVAAIGAPSSLAVELARANNQTLVGFLRGDGFNAYTGVERLRS